MLSNTASASAVALQKRYAAVHNALAQYFALRRNLDPLVLDLQDDPATRENHDEYLLGPDLLVAPALDQNPTRLVYLPAGEWHNIFTNEKFIGPTTIVAPTPLDTIPVFARAEAALPKAFTDWLAAPQHASAPDISPAHPQTR